MSRGVPNGSLRLVMNIPYTQYPMRSGLSTFSGEPLYPVFFFFFFQPGLFLSYSFRVMAAQLSKCQSEMRTLSVLQLAPATELRAPVARLTLSSFRSPRSLTFSCTIGPPGHGLMQLAVCSPSAYPLTCRNTFRHVC